MLTKTCAKSEAIEAVQFRFCQYERRRGLFDELECTCAVICTDCLETQRGQDRLKLCEEIATLIGHQGQFHRTHGFFIDYTIFYGL